MSESNEHRKLDKALVQDALDGDKAALAVLDAQLEKWLEYMCNTLDAHRRKDLKQRVLVRVANGLSALRDQNAIVGWLKTIVKREVATWFAANKDALDASHYQPGHGLKKFDRIDDPNSNEEPTEWWHDPVRDKPWSKQLTEIIGAANNLPLKEYLDNQLATLYADFLHQTETRGKSGTDFFKVAAARRVGMWGYKGLGAQSAPELTPDKFQEIEAVAKQIREKLTGNRSKDKGTAVKRYNDDLAFREEVLAKRQMLEDADARHGLLHQAEKQPPVKKKSRSIRADWPHRFTDTARTASHRDSDDE